MFLIQAAESAVLLDDWFQLRYWQNHELGPAAIWSYARHNYFHYNPRIGEVILVIIDGSRAIHLIATPVVQLALLAFVFVIAFGRWPRPTLRDLQLLVVIQTLIWLVIPSPAILYFYRPFATNYLWAFTITLALFVPYRLGTRARSWLAPIMLVLGWAAGMCNEHTGPTAMVVMAAMIYTRRRELRAWMVAGMVGLYVGYPMLFFAPGQAVRYGGMATRLTPKTVLIERGVTGCFEIVRSFAFEARLGFVVVIAAAISYLAMRYLRGERIPIPPRSAVLTAAVLAGAALAIVATLFVSPTASGRVLFASGVLLAAAFAVCMQELFAVRIVRRFVVGACVVIFGYHIVRFVDATKGLAPENAQRLALLQAAAPGSVAIVPPYTTIQPSRWVFGDDFVVAEWLRDYVAGDLYDLSRVDLEQRERPPAVRFELRPATHLAPPTYRQLQAPWMRAMLAAQLGRFTIEAYGLFDDAHHRPVIVLGDAFVDGRSYDNSHGHYIRIAELPAHIGEAYEVACGSTFGVAMVRGPGGDVLLPVDERWCRGPFTAIVCDPDRCYVAGSR